MSMRRAKMIALFDLALCLIRRGWCICLTMESWLRERNRITSTPTFTVVERTLIFWTGTCSISKAAIIGILKTGEDARTIRLSFGARGTNEKWWRRRELNPRPWQINQQRLHA